MGRIGSFLTAEELPDPYLIDPKREDAISVDGDFQWETTYQSNNGDSKFQTGKPSGGRGKKDNKDEKPKKDVKASGKRRSLFGKQKTDSVLPVASTAPENTGELDEKKADKPFELKDLKLHIKKGAFVAIVGTVGSGKVCTTIITASSAPSLIMPSEFAAASPHWRDAEDKGRLCLLRASCVRPSVCVDHERISP